MNTQRITVETLVSAPLDKVWNCFTDSKHVTGWNFASDDWHSPRGESDLRAGGRFSYRMEAKDGSEGFDFGGTYGEVVPMERYSYAMDDGRKVNVMFSQEGDKVRVTETFDPEGENPIEMQRQGWQAILDNFKKYVERQG